MCAALDGSTFRLRARERLATVNFQRRTALERRGRNPAKTDSPCALVGCMAPGECPMSFTLIRRVPLAALLIACAGAPSSALASSRHDATEASIIHVLNGVRATYGLPRLHTSPGLAKAADVHSASMQ